MVEESFVQLGCGPVFGQNAPPERTRYPTPPNCANRQYIRPGPAGHYAGPSHAPKLIDALTHFKASQSADFPAGDVIMDPNDHQGRTTQYVTPALSQRLRGQSRTS